MKKLLVAVVAISMIVCAMGLTAFADANEASIGDVSYPTLKAAFEAVKDGDTIKVLKDIEFTAGDTAAGRPQDAISYSGAASFTLDINGCTLSSTGLGSGVDANSIFRINTSGNEDASAPQTIEIKNGTLATENFYKCIVATGNESGVLTINLKDLTLKNAKTNSAAVEVWYDAVLNATNVTVESKLGGCVHANDGGIANIYSGTFTQKQAATTNSHMSTCVMAGYDSVVNVYDGTYNSDLYSVYLFPTGSEINIYGGTFDAATAVRADAYDDAVSVVNIEGGTFSGVLYTSGTNADINISGGKFDTAVSDKYFAEGYEAVKNAEGAYEFDKESDVPLTINAAVKENGNADVALNAGFDKWDGTEKSFGMYIYKYGTKEGAKVMNAGNSLVDGNGLFNVKITDIPKSAFNTVLVCVPFVIDANDVMTIGNIKTITAGQLLGIN